MKNGDPLGVICLYGFVGVYFSETDLLVVLAVLVQHLSQELSFMSIT
jgi:hypothetical protein